MPAVKDVEAQENGYKNSKPLAQTIVHKLLSTNNCPLTIVHKKKHHRIPNMVIREMVTKLMYWLSSQAALRTYY